MNEKVIQKYLNTDLHSGSITINKEYIANVIDMVRVTPNSLRVLLLLCSYASRNNKVITDVRSIAKLLGFKEEENVKSYLRNLISNGWIEMSTIRLSHSNDIIGVRHDRDLYMASNKLDWEVTDNKFITNFKLSGEFNIFTINESMITCEETTEAGSNLILSLKGNLFYDKTITQEDIEIGVDGQ